MAASLAGSGPRGPVTAIVVGAGNRGNAYAQYALETPDRLRIVGVAEPRPWPRSQMVEKFGIASTHVWSDWKELAALPKQADAVFITTQDQMHKEPAVAFANLGYHILLEKPMAVSPQDCHAIIAAVKRNGVFLAVGHVLRYTPYMQKIVSLIRRGEIGEVVNIQHLEPVGFFHFAHSYVRGNWRREDLASSMLMAKCCHDVDLLRAEKIYLDQAKSGHFGWPVAPILSDAPSVEAVETALREGNYGKCVWASDNNVLDHQVVNFEFEGGATANLTVVAFTEKLCQRSTTIHGTRGELQGDGERKIRHFDFLTRSAVTYEVDMPPVGSRMTGHGGADYFLAKGFVDAVFYNDASHIVSGPDETLESHLMVFAAEHAREAERVVDVRKYIDALTSASADGDGAAVPATATADPKLDW